MGSDWTLLSTHGLVLLAVAAAPNATQREIAATLGVTERTVQNAVGDLVAAGYLERMPVGRRNRYRVRVDQPLRHPLSRRVADLADLISAEAAEESQPK